jgi:hypothetical protein
MEGYGVPARPSPTITQCLNGGYPPPFSKTFRAARGEYFATGPPWLFDLLKSSAFTGRAINFF